MQFSDILFQVQPRVESNMFLHRAGRCGRAGKAGVNTVIASDGDVADREAITNIRKVIDMEVIDGSLILRKWHYHPVLSKLLVLPFLG